MGDFIPKDGSGSLFRNGYKEKDSQPDWRGDLMFKGELLEVAAWQNKTREGKTYLKLSVQPKQERAQRDSGAAYRAARDGDRTPADDFEDFGDPPF